MSAIGSVIAMIILRALPTGLDQSGDMPFARVIAQDIAGTCENADKKPANGRKADSDCIPAL